MVSEYFDYDIMGRRVPNHDRLDPALNFSMERNVVPKRKARFEEQVDEILAGYSFVDKNM